MADWRIYVGSRTEHDDISRLPDPPPWRKFGGGSDESVDKHAAEAYVPTEAALEAVNAALYLRRPLLVTGLPGTGKSTLAYAVAHELRLGPVLHWPITSRVVLREGLYQYDPLSRLYGAEQGVRKTGRSAAANDTDDDDIGEYIRLGPLGTALLPYEKPRVLLIDEIDKSDIDLPNDLLTVFERGSYEIIELARRAKRTARVMTADNTVDRVEITDGTVTCNAFPLIILTSNGEREFPPAFKRRCVLVELKPPETSQELTEIVNKHLAEVIAENGEFPETAAKIIGDFFERARSGTQLANDQLLNAIYLCHQAALEQPGLDIAGLAKLVTFPLGSESGPDDSRAVG